MKLKLLTSFIISFIAISCGKTSRANPQTSSSITPTPQPTPTPTVTPNTLTVTVDTSKTCADKSLTFCATEKLLNNQSYSLTFSLDKDSVTFTAANPFVLTAEQKSLGFTLSKNENCKTTLQASATPCILTLTYSPNKSTPVDKNSNPIPQNLTLNFPYLNNIQQALNVTENVSYEAASLLSTPAPIPNGLNISAVVQANIENSTEVMLTNDNKLYTNFTSYIADIVYYNANQIASGRIIAETNYPFTFLRVMGLLPTLLFDNSPKGVAIGKMASYGFFDDGSTQCVPTNLCAPSFAPKTYPLVYIRNYHFVDTSNTADKLYVFSNPYGQTDGAHLSSINPQTGEEIATSTGLVIPDEMNKVLYTLAVNNNIFVTLYNQTTQVTTLQYYREDDSAKAIAAENSSLYSTIDTIQYAPVYDEINNYVYLVTKSDNTLHTINLTTGKEVWSHKFIAPISAPFIIRQNRNVAIASSDGHIYVLDLIQGAAILTYQLSTTGSINPLAVAFDSKKNLLYIPSSDTITNDQVIYSFRTDW